MALSWEVPDGGGCATREQLHDQVERLAEHELAARARNQTYRIEAQAFTHEGSWVARVTLLDEQGRFLGGRTRIRGGGEP